MRSNEVEGVGHDELEHRALPFIPVRGSATVRWAVTGVLEMSRAPSAQTLGTTMTASVANNAPREVMFTDDRYGRTATPRALMLLGGQSTP